MVLPINDRLLFFFFFSIQFVQPGLLLSAMPLIPGLIRTEYDILVALIVCSAESTALLGNLSLWLEVRW